MVIIHFCESKEQASFMISKGRRASRNMVLRCGDIAIDVDFQEYRSKDVLNSILLNGAVLGETIDELPDDLMCLIWGQKKDKKCSN